MFQLLTSAADITRLLSSENAIVFVFAAWSGPSRKSRKTVSDACEIIQRKTPALELSIAELDFTKQEGEIWDWTETWLSRQDNVNVGTFLYSGAGSVVWIRDRLIVDSVVNADKTGVDELVDRSLIAFGGCPQMTDGFST